MFEDYSTYEREKVHLFLKYLAYASLRHVKKQQREEKLNKRFTDDDTTSENNEHKNLGYKELIKQRLNEIDEKRRQQLENKIELHYSNNMFLPYENKLKKLKAKYNRLKKNKNQDKTKLKHVKSKIVKCDELLKKLKHSQITSH